MINLQGGAVMKRLILLALIISGCLLSISYAQPFRFQEIATKKEYRVLSSPNGRFVFGQISDSSKDQYMLDTWTGRLWRISESGEIGKFLAPIPYKTKDGRYLYVPEEVSKSKK